MGLPRALSTAMCQRRHAGRFADLYDVGVAQSISGAAMVVSVAAGRRTGPKSSALKAADCACLTINARLRSRFRGATTSVRGPLKVGSSFATSIILSDQPSSTGPI